MSCGHEVTDCPICDAPVRLIAAYGAPGVGYHCRCDLGHDWAMVHGNLYDPRAGVHIGSPEDFR